MDEEVTQAQEEVKVSGDGGTQMVAPRTLRIAPQPCDVHVLTYLCDALGGASPKVQLLCLLLSCQSWEAHAAGRRRQGHRQQRSPWSDNRDVDQYATHLTQLAWPVLQNLGFSGAVGLVCAVAFKVWPTVACTSPNCNTNHVITPSTQRLLDAS